ncbi:hypothetical protein IKD67_01655, partial [Candidatus Saccharibacteria bacterium]|nr:hypothetical protein [Candidatus Saccharibacteria bacterium]
DPGTYEEYTGTGINVSCNDPGGYALYAIGFSGDSYDAPNNNRMLGLNSTYIPTGNSGDGSYWAMKVAGSSTTSTVPTIDNSYSTYQIIPATYTMVSHYGSSTTGTTTNSVTTPTYKVQIASDQPVGTYAGKVKYTMVHPSTAPAPTPPSPIDPPTSCPTPVLNLTYMQDLNSSNKASVLASMTEDSQYYLADKRDDKAYCVAKLKDGNIWMTQNLDHDIKTDGTVTYDSTTTDIAAAWTPSTATYPTGTTTWNYSATAPESYDPGELYWSGTPDDDIPVSTGDSHYHLGNYYNWTAAVAMNDSSSYTTQYQDANQSICPANWTLPKSGNVTTGGSFQYLVNQYGWSDYEMTNPYIWNSPIKTSLSGYWGGSLESVGGGGLFLSPVVYDSYDSYRLYAFSDGLVAPDDFDSRDYGFSVRCLAR